MNVNNINDSKNINSEKIKKVSKEFEAYFINEMLKFKLSSSMLDNSIYSDLLGHELSLKIADKGIGISEFIIKNINKNILSEKH
jgi:Rod binding domain-containing protein